MIYKISKESAFWKCWFWKNLCTYLQKGYYFRERVVCWFWLEMWKIPNFELPWLASTIYLCIQNGHFQFSLQFVEYENFCPNFRQFWLILFNGQLLHKTIFSHNSYLVNLRQFQSVHLVVLLLWNLWLPPFKLLALASSFMYLKTIWWCEIFIWNWCYISMPPF